MRSLSRRMKELREKRGITVREMARRVGVPESTYRDWEYGSAIKGEPYLAIARALDIGVHELLSGEAPDLSRALDRLERIRAAAEELRSELRSWARDGKSIN